MTVTNIFDVQKRIKAKQGKTGESLPKLSDIPECERAKLAVRLLEFAQNLIYVSHCLYTCDLDSLTAEHRAYVGQILGEPVPEANDDSDSSYNYVLRHGREIRDMADGVAGTASEILDDVKNYLKELKQD